MLVTMKQQDFDSLDDDSLIWACIEPTIQKTRGKDPSVKANAYAGLSEGQKALFMFQVMYGHSSTGIVEFYCLVPYLPSGRGIWQALKKGMQHFEDDAMLRLLGEMEVEYSAIEEKSLADGSERLDVCIKNLDMNSALMASINQHNIMFGETIPATIKGIAAFIRKNPFEFVRVEE